MIQIYVYIYILYISGIYVYAAFIHNYDNKSKNNATKISDATRWCPKKV